MKYALAMAMGLAAFGASASAQINALFPGQLSAPRATAERSLLLESTASLTFDGKKVTRNVGDSSNPLYKVTLDEGMRLTGLDWSLNVSTTSPVKISDLRIAIYTLGENGKPNNGVLVGPGQGLNSSGNLVIADERLGLSGDDGIINLSGLSLDFGPGSDGAVYIELYNTYGHGSINLKSGSKMTMFTSNVPAPSTAAMLGLAGLAATRRRRNG